MLKLRRLGMDSSMEAGMKLVQTKEEIIQRLESNRSILRNFGIAQIGLFGSFVRDEQHEESDVDLLADFLPGKKTFENFMDAAFFLEDLMGRRVDLLTREGLSPYIGPYILKELQYVPIAA